jgi:hypothetical protein
VRRSFTPYFGIAIWAEAISEFYTIWGVSKGIAYRIPAVFILLQLTATRFWVLALGKHAHWHIDHRL